ncbi:MAG: hypothetical protein ACRC28_16550 [Clostridium sp.]|uniref:hypothetical protein n=1 Tax=Clostridium sp. TaxID=1506 RepID=UPI003F3BCDC1
MKNDRLEKELKNSFKKTFSEQKLGKDFYNKLEERLEKEKIEEKSLKRKIEVLMEREIEIDIRGIIGVAIIMLMLPTIFSLKEITEEYKEEVKSQIVLNKK